MMRDWMIEKRTNAGMTQGELADCIKTTRQMISAVENGKRDPSPKLAKRIADTLGLDWTLFYETSGNNRDG